MLLEIYIFMWIVAVVAMFGSFYFHKSGKEFLILPFISMFFFAFVGLSSYAIEKGYCNSNIENYMNATLPSQMEIKWSCYSSNDSERGLAWFAYGLAAVMLIYGIIRSVSDGANFAGGNQ